VKKKTLTNILTKGITILLIILVSLISFLGIHKKNLNGWRNILPEYTLSKELSNIRTFVFSVDTSTEEVEDKDAVPATESTESQEGEQTTNTTETPKKQVPVNDTSVLTLENYKKSKDLISERLKRFGVTDYSVTLNEKTGEISVDVPYQSITDYTVSLAINKGTLAIIDSETKETLISKDMIKSVSVNYKASDSTNTESKYPSYDIGLVLTFKKDGQSKLNEITKKYIATTNENGESSTKYVIVQIDGEDKYQTYFTPDGQYTELFIPLSQNVSTENMQTFNDKRNEAAVVASELNTESMPIKYSLTKGTFIESTTSNNFLIFATIFGAIIIIIISIIMIAKYKANGLIAAIIEIGFIAIHSLLIRATKVSLTLSGLTATLLVALINYMIIKLLMNKEKAIDQLKAYGKILFNMIPLIITIIVFTLSKNIHLQSVGMVAVWGVIISTIYTLLTSILLLRKNNTKNGVE